MHASIRVAVNQEAFDTIKDALYKGGPHSVSRIGWDPTDGVNTLYLDTIEIRADKPLGRTAEGPCDALLVHTMGTGAEIFQKGYTVDGTLSAAVFCVVGPNSASFVAAVRQWLIDNGYVEGLTLPDTVGDGAQNR